MRSLHVHVNFLKLGFWILVLGILASCNRKVSEDPAQKVAIQRCFTKGKMIGLVYRSNIDKADDIGLRSAFVMDECNLESPENCQEQCVLGFKRGQATDLSELHYPPIIEFESAIEKYARSMGRSVGTLTSEDQRQALLEAIQEKAKQGEALGFY